MKIFKKVNEVYRIATVLVSACIVLLANSCNKEDDTQQSTTLTVYTAGYSANNYHSNLIPCYWKNDILVDLPLLDPDKQGYAYDIDVVGNIVYTVGNTQNNNSTVVPCYWKNETRIDLPVLDPTKNGFARGIQVVGGAVFTAGYSYRNDGNAVPCYWINSTRVDLPLLDPTGYGQASDIKVVGNTIYTVGYTMNNNIRVPCYWINDVLVVLPAADPEEDGEAKAIQVAENEIYIAGYTKIDDGSYLGIRVPCYWTSEARTDLPTLENNRIFNLLYPIAYDLGYFDEFELYSALLDNDVEGEAYAIDVTGNKVYVAGYNDFNIHYIRWPLYWTNGIQIDLPIMLPSPLSGSRRTSHARAIQVVGDSVYTAGFFSNYDRYVPCYWINYDTRIDLPVLNPNYNGRVYAMQVVEE